MSDIGKRQEKRRAKLLNEYDEFRWTITRIHGELAGMRWRRAKSLIDEAVVDLARLRENVTVVAADMSLSGDEDDASQVEG